MAQNYNIRIGFDYEYAICWLTGKKPGFENETKNTHKRLLHSSGTALDARGPKYGTVLVRLVAQIPGSKCKTLLDG